MGFFVENAGKFAIGFGVTALCFAAAPLLASGAAAETVILTVRGVQLTVKGAKIIGCVGAGLFGTSAAVAGGVAYNRESQARARLEEQKRQQNQDHQQNRQRQTSEKNALRLQIQQLMKRVQTLQTEINQKTEQLAVARRSLSNLRQERNASIQTITEKQVLISTQQQQIGTLQETVNRLNEMLRRKNNEIASQQQDAAMDELSDDEDMPARPAMSM
jgi:chromosome segregation ATPase